MQSPSDYIIK